MAHQPAKIPSAERLFDEYLAAAARTGDRPAFERLARRWHGRLAAHAWRLTGDREMARDAAQSGWEEIARSIAKLHDVRAFPAWAYRIVSRRCARAVTGIQRRRVLDRALADMPPEPASETPAATEREGRLQIAIRALPPAQGAAIALFYLEEMSVAEVAVALDVPVGTVKTRLMHARRHLKTALEGEHDE